MEFLVGDWSIGHVCAWSGRIKKPISLYMIQN